MKGGGEKEAWAKRKRKAHWTRCERRGARDFAQKARRKRTHARDKVQKATQKTRDTTDRPRYKLERRMLIK